MKYLNAVIEKIPREIRYIFMLFVSTRIVLTIIATFARVYSNKTDLVQYTKYIFLNIWGVWDTSWYLNIAENGYSPIPIVDGHANYVFFPLYPMLIKIIGYMAGNQYYIAGLIISNVALIIACIFLYKLVKMDDDEETALSSVKYLFLFPSAFILSGVFSESLFLALVIACFYYARKGNWYMAGTLGFFLALTRSLGVLAIIPLGYEYLKSKNFNLKNMNADVLFLLLIPLGLSVFSLYNYYLTGDFLAFAHNESAWGRHFSNPVQVMFEGFTGSLQPFLWSVIGLMSVVILTVFIKKIGFSYWLLGMYSTLIPFTSGHGESIPRYILIIFPFFILFARLGKNRQIDTYLTIILALLQGYFIVPWTTQTFII